MKISGPCLLLKSVSSHLVTLQINMTHLIKHLSFGKDYPGIVNPLDDTVVSAPQGQSFRAFYGLMLVGITQEAVQQ